MNILKKTIKDIGRWLYAPEGSENRAYQRYRLYDQTLVCASLGGETPVEINDISYGGIGLRLSGGSSCSWEDIPDKVSIKISLLDQSAVIEATRAHYFKDMVGWCFHHKTTDSLVFLRLILENMRRGASLKSLDEWQIEDSEKEELDGDSYRFVGDDNTDLKITLDDKRELRRLILVFTDGEYRHEFIFSHGELQTKSEIEGKRDSTSVRCLKFEKPVVRQSMFILLGIEHAKLQPVIKDLLGQCLAALRAS